MIHKRPGILTCLVSIALAAPVLGAVTPRAAGAARQAAAAAVTSMADVADSVLSAAYPASGPGATAIVVQNGRVVFRKAYGMAHVELGVPMRPEMVLRIGSVTKQFTAAAILMLEQEGKLSVQDNVTKHLPEYPTKDRTITIEHLLTHTSGIRSYTGMPSWRPLMPKDMTVAEMIDLFKGEPMDFPPGERFLYNNSGFFLLGAIIERVSGRTYEQFLNERIFAPLGMTHTYYDRTDRIIPGRAAGYGRGDAGLANAEYLSMSHPYSAGALASNVDDLARWDAALYTDTLLSADARRRQWTPYRLANGKDTNYGYGWGIGMYAGRQVVEHGGGIPGFVCHVIRIPDARLFVAVLSNGTGGTSGPDFVARTIAAAAIGSPLPTRLSTPLPTATLDRYTGVYRIDSTTTRVITREGTTLYSQKSGGPKAELEPISADRFMVKGSTAVLTFEPAGGGAASRVVMNDWGRTDTGDRTHESLSRSPVAVRVDPKIYGAYVGRYELAPGLILTVTREGDRLMTQATGQASIEIFPESETTFFAKVIDAKITFVKDAAGAVTGLTLQQAWQERQAKKIR